MIHVLNTGGIVGKQFKGTIRGFFAKVYLLDAGAHMLNAGFLQKMDVTFGFRVIQGVVQNL